MAICNKVLHNPFYFYLKKKQYKNKYNVFGNFKKISKNVIKNHLAINKNNIIKSKLIHENFDKKLIEIYLNNDFFREKHWKQTYLWPTYFLKKMYIKLNNQKKGLKIKKFTAFRKVYNKNKNIKNLNKEMLHKTKFYKFNKKKYQFLKDEHEKKQKEQLIKILNKKQIWMKYFLKKMVKFNNKKLKLLIRRLGKIQNKC